MQAVLVFLTIVFGTPNEKGRASTFFPVERMNNGILACDGGRVWEDPNELLIAHRTLPCGTIVLVENIKTGKAVIARVLDRGPYGGLMPDGTWVLKRPRDVNTKDAVYRGIADLSPGVKGAIGMSSMGYVRLYWLRFPKHIKPRRPNS